MSVKVLLPQLGFSMEEGRLVSWLVGDGEMVAKGAPLYELEGDKAVEEVEAPEAGRLKIVAAPDQVYPVGTLLAELL